MSQPTHPSIPPTYLQGSDEFNPAYLAWLATTTNTAGICPYRITRDEHDTIIRFEVWIDGSHVVFPVGRS